MNLVSNSRLALFTTLAILLSNFTNTANASLTYSLDDGTGENAYGVGANTFTWTNQFNAIDGYKMITDISAAFGNLTVGEFDGRNITVSLWDDVDNDGTPNDLRLLTSLESTITSSGTDIFSVFDIDDTLVSGSFFAGITMVTLTGEFPARTDFNSTYLNRSWFGVGLLLPTTNVVCCGGNVMVRANAIPAPASVGLIVLGLVFLFGSRNRK